MLPHSSRPTKAITPMTTKTETFTDEELVDRLRRTLTKERNVLQAERNALVDIYRAEDVPVVLSTKALLMNALIDRLDTLLAAMASGVFPPVYTTEMQNQIEELRGWMKPIEDPRGHHIAVYDTLAKLHHDDPLTGASWPQITAIACRCNSRRGVHSRPTARPTRSGSHRTEVPQGFESCGRTKYAK